jgi:hypothetical protein
MAREGLRDSTTHSDTLIAVGRVVLSNQVASWERTPLPFTFPTRHRHGSASAKPGISGESVDSVITKLANADSLSQEKFSFFSQFELEDRFFVQIPKRKPVRGLDGWNHPHALFS